MDTRTNRNATPRPHNDYYLGWILKMAAAANAEISEATQAVYLERLRRLSGDEMRTAGERTISEWDEPSKMPPLPFILERAAKPSNFRDDAPAILGRSDKPQLPGQIETAEERADFAARVIEMAAMKEMPPVSRPDFTEKTAVPETPKRRKAWATKTAKERGWI